MCFYHSLDLTLKWSWLGLEAEILVFLRLVVRKVCPRNHEYLSVSRLISLSSLSTSPLREPSLEASVWSNCSWRWSRTSWWWSTASWPGADLSCFITVSLSLDQCSHPAAWLNVCVDDWKVCLQLTNDQGMLQLFTADTLLWSDSVWLSKCGLTVVWGWFFTTPAHTPYIHIFSDTNDHT